MATKSISQLDSAVSVSNGDLYETAVPDSGSVTGYASKKQSLAAIADHIATQVNYPTFATSAKSIIGAVNQVLGNLAPAYDSTATYETGDVVIYEGNLYKANSDISTPEAFDPAKWDQGTAADFFEGGGSGDLLVAASSNYMGYGTNAGINKAYVDPVLHAGETFVLVVSHRSALTLPADLTVLHTGANGDNSQYITFAIYTAAATEQKVWTIQTASTNRLFIDWAIFRNCTVTYSGNYFQNYSGQATVTAPTKTAGEILLWCASALSWSTGTNGIWETSPVDVLRISQQQGKGDTAPRQAIFYDDGTGATARTFTITSPYNPVGQISVDAVTITPN